MVLPNRDHSQIPDEKLTQYLLALNHPVGHSKAVFFRGVGYDESNIEKLRDGLLAIAKNEEAQEEISTDYGMKYVIHGSLNTPSGRTVSVTTIWIIEEAETSPRFVTAYPADGEEEN